MRDYYVSKKGALEFPKDLLMIYVIKIITCAHKMCILRCFRCKQTKFYFHPGISHNDVPVALRNKSYKSHLALSSEHRPDVSLLRRYELCVLNLFMLCVQPKKKYHLLGLQERLCRKSWERISWEKKSCCLFWINEAAQNIWTLCPNKCYGGLCKTYTLITKPSVILKNTNNFSQWLKTRTSLRILS